MALIDDLTEESAEMLQAIKPLLGMYNYTFRLVEENKIILIPTNGTTVYSDGRRQHDRTD